MDPTMLGPITGSLALSIELVIGTALEPLADTLYPWLLIFGGLGL